jgi:hypothetical protein
MPWRCMESGRIDSHFLDLGTCWMWVVSFTPRPLYPRGKSPQYQLDRRLGGPQSRSGRLGENCWPYQGLNSDPSVHLCLSESPSMSISTEKCSAIMNAIMQHMAGSDTQKYCDMLGDLWLGKVGYSDGCEMTLDELILKMEEVEPWKERHQTPNYNNYNRFTNSHILQFGIACATPSTSSLGVATQWLPTMGTPPPQCPQPGGNCLKTTSDWDFLGMLTDWCLPRCCLARDAWLRLHYCGFQASCHIIH